MSVLCGGSSGPALSGQEEKREKRHKALLTEINFLRVCGGDTGVGGGVRAITLSFLM